MSVDGSARAHPPRARALEPVPLAGGHPGRPGRPLRHEHARGRARLVRRGDRAPRRDPAQRLPGRLVPAAQARDRRPTPASTREQVVVGAGCDEVLALCAQLALGRGDRALVAKPTYQLYAVASRNAGAEVLALDPGRRPRARRARRSCARRPACASSGSAARTTPPASSSAPTDVERICERLPRHRRARPGVPRARRRRSLRPRRASTTNLVVARTFSKGFALGAARVGYGLAQPALAEALDAPAPARLDLVLVGGRRRAGLPRDRASCERTLRCDRRGARPAGRRDARARASRCSRTPATSCSLARPCPMCFARLARARLRRAHVRARAVAGRLLPRHRLAPRRQRPPAARARRAGAAARRRQVDDGVRGERTRRACGARRARPASRCASASSAAGAPASRRASASSTTCSRAWRSGR